MDTSTLKSGQWDKYGGSWLLKNMCILKGVGTPNEIRRWHLNKVGTITALYYKHLSEILFFL